jgi:hypothetical protein
MKSSDPNQALRRGIGISTALLSVNRLGLIIIGVGVTGPA